jgi:hypothetical protein
MKIFFLINLSQKSSNSPTEVRGLIPEIVEVHCSKGEENFLVFICFGGELNAKLVSPGENFIKASIVNVAYLSHF